MDNWEEAAMQSKRKRAVAPYGIIQTKSGNHANAEIIMQQGKDPVMVYYHTQRVIRQATAQEVDKTRRWRPF